MSTWQCPNCELINSNQREKCQACFTDHPIFDEEKALNELKSKGLPIWEQKEDLLTQNQSNNLWHCIISILTSKIPTTNHKDLLIYWLISNFDQSEYKTFHLRTTDSELWYKRASQALNDVIKKVIIGEFIYGEEESENENKNDAANKPQIIASNETDLVSVKVAEFVGLVLFIVDLDDTYIFKKLPQSLCFVVDGDDSYIDPTRQTPQAEMRYALKGQFKKRRVRFEGHDVKEFEYAPDEEAEPSDLDFEEDDDL